MERLIVTNFLVIKQADFEVGKFNLIIGQQASGKSVLAKLLYFFREFITSTYFNSVKNFDNKKAVEKRGLYNFENYFPKYTWHDKDFEIIYKVNDIEISIKQKISNTNNAPLKLDYSSTLISLHKKLKNAYKKKLFEYEREQGFEDVIGDPFWKIVENYIYKTDIASSFNRSLFIPASRSFFASLQKSVFSFLANNIEVDPFIRDFGSQYESAKRLYGRRQVYSYRREASSEKLIKQINELIETILVGRYKYEEEQDWIVFQNQRINLANASSGQQEALPMLLIMSVWPFRGKGIHTYFIEEPEAHLFPLSQKHLVSLMALIFKKLKHHFVITTHSPYILTAINNLILKNDIRNQNNSEKFDKQFVTDYSIDYEEVKAYTFENGRLVSILDDEARLVGSNVIDSVSDEFETEFDTLLALQVDN